MFTSSLVCPLLGKLIEWNLGVVAQQSSTTKRILKTSGATESIWNPITTNYMKRLLGFCGVAPTAIIPVYMMSRFSADTHCLFKWGWDRLSLRAQQSGDFRRLLNNLIAAIN